MMRQFQIHRFQLVLWLISGLASLPSYATIIADGHAPAEQQPTILSTANGRPQINIQTPDEHGVSRNQYQQFDVDNRGAILNNSHNVTRTELAGQITGNPWLAKQEARIIVNEVNSPHLSQLNGVIEVAGRRAEVIIANPYGITCNGCGFINAEQISLVAGRARIEEGQLKGFDVNNGRINITGLGLNAENTDYTRLIARAVDINAQVQTQGDLRLTTGRNKTDAKGNITQIKPQEETHRPTFALDVAVLGGMYANKIVLEGTESGVGVRNAGKLGAMVGELSLSINGELINRGQLSGQESLTGILNQDIHNTGILTAGGNLELSTPTTLHNEGLIRSSQDINLTAAVINSTTKSALAAVPSHKGIIGSSGNLRLTASGELKAQGLNLADNHLRATGSSVDLANSKTYARRVTLTATQQDISTANAVVQGRDETKVEAATWLNNHKGTLQGINTLSLNIIDAVDNRGGHLLAEGNIILTAAKLNNRRGEILCVGDGQLTVHHRLDNTAGLISADGALSLATKYAKNRDTRPSGKGITANNLNITAQRINNTEGAIQAIDSLNATVQKAIDNKHGLILSQGSLQVMGAALNINNQNGTLIAGKHASINAPSLSGDGQLLSKGKLTVSLVKDFHNTGTVKANNDLTLTTLGRLINEAHLTGQQVLTLIASNLTNGAQGILSAKGTHLSARNTLNNTGLIDGELTHIRARIINNTDSGRIWGDQLAITASELNNLKNGNKSAVIAARERLDIGASKVNNRDNALMTSMRDIAFGGSLDTRLRAVGQGDQLNNHGASVEAGGNMFINMQKLNNTNRHLVTKIAQVGKFQCHEGGLKGHKTRYLWQQVKTHCRNKGGVHDAIMPDGSKSDEFYEYHYQRTVHETQIKESEPGKILSAQNLHFNTTHLTNYDSQIVAGGKLTSKIVFLRNQATEGERKIRDKGSMIHWFAKKVSKRFGGIKVSQGKDNFNYRPAATVQKIDLNVLSWLENTILKGSDIHAGQRQIYDDGLMANLTGSESVIEKKRLIPLLHSVSFDIDLPYSALYTLHPDTDRHYRVKTVPPFVNKKQWLTSDYMQNMLKVDHSHTHKRLGDGYYEQKRVRDQLIQRNAHHSSGNHIEDETQYLALLNSGIAFRKSYQLQPGVVLTPAQMAFLTTDIIGLVDLNVQLADGRTSKVRVPKMYARLENDDLSHDGALLSGKN